MYPFADSQKLKRYFEGQEAFMNRDLWKKEFGGKPWFMPYSQTREKKVINKVPGWTLLDQALSAAAETSSTSANFYTWESIGATNPELAKKAGGWEASPEQNTIYVKKAAGVFGSGDTGVAKVNEKWFYSQEGSYSGDGKGKKIIFSDNHDKPTITKDTKYIPKSMNRVVVMLAPMDGALTMFTPSRLGAVADNLGYSRMAEMAIKVAEFIRGLGYNAIPMGNDTGLSVPMAIDAGLGELGRHGLLINPKFGTLVRICKIVTDMPLAPDKPIKFGAAEFCRTCMKCADECPSGSISKDKDPSYDVACPSNNPGMKKWYVNTWSCLKFWTENGGGCVTCQSVCPYSKPQTWIHDLVKGVSAKTSIFNSTFTTLDDVLGYGTTLKDNDPMKWWNSKEKPKEWPNYSL
jgi:reductive dehalogenase